MNVADVTKLKNPKHTWRVVLFVVFFVVLVFGSALGVYLASRSKDTNEKKLVGNVDTLGKELDAATAVVSKTLENRNILCKQHDVPDNACDSNDIALWCEASHNTYPTWVDSPIYKKQGGCTSYLRQLSARIDKNFNALKQEFSTNFEDLSSLTRCSVKDLEVVLTIGSGTGNWKGGNGKWYFDENATTAKEVGGQINHEGCMDEHMTCTTISDPTKLNYLTFKIKLNGTPLQLRDDDRRELNPNDDYTWKSIAVSANVSYMAVTQAKHFVMGKSALEVLSQMDPDQVDEDAIQNILKTNYLNWKTITTTFNTVITNPDETIWQKGQLSLNQAAIDFTAYLQKIDAPNKVFEPELKKIFSGDTPPKFF